jgi:FAD-dependent oxidoreductase family protein
MYKTGRYGRTGLIRMRSTVPSVHSGCHNSAHGSGNKSIMKKFDIIVVGAGSGGIGAAWSAAQCGAKVLLIEKSPILGGTFSRAEVSCWEASISGTGLAERIYREADKYQDAVDIYPHLWEKKDYDLTLKVNGLNINDKIGKDIKGRYGVIIEPDVYADVVLNLLEATGNCKILFNSEFRDVASDGSDIKFIEIFTNGKIERLTANIFIDATGNIMLAEKAGSKVTIGAESKSLYNEDFAPMVEMPEKINCPTLIFRVTEDPLRMLKPPEWTLNAKEDIPPRSLHLQRFANGDYHVNALPTLTAEEFHCIPEENIYQEAVFRTWNIWKKMKSSYPELENYEICSLAPELGIREGKRIISEYVLTQNDILDGLGNHKYNDTIAVADHMFDMHGVSHGHKTELLKEPYGIPFRSLVPQGWNNLLVACRGAGFSQIATSSCRLSRTMMQLGQAAGTAAAQVTKEHSHIKNIDSRILRKSLETQGVVLDKKVLENRYCQAIERSGVKK